METFFFTQEPLLTPLQVTMALVMPPLGRMKRRPLDSTTFLMTTCQFDERVEKEAASRLALDREADEVQLKVVSALFRKENIKYKDDAPVPTKKRWIWVYPHPMTGLKQMMAKQTLREVYNLPPEQRVSWAAASNNAWLIEELALRGHDCEVPNASGYRPLHTAARYDFTECLMVLMAVGCNINAESMMGFTPLYVARAAGAERAAALLEGSGALERLPVKPLPGVRTVLDCDGRPEGLRRAADIRGRNLRRRPYVGQF